MSKKKSKSKSTMILLMILILLALAFAVITISTARSTYDKKVAAEKITEPDFYSMQKFCGDNSSAVMKALKDGSEEKLEKLMISSEGLEEVMGFAEWSGADLENVVSLGAGSFSAAPDENGKMDISERFFVTVGEEKYVLYIETLTSRHGMINEGVSSIGVTTYEHFDALDYSWNGDKDDNSAVAGESFIKE